MSYEFKRNFYPKVKKSIDSFHVTILTGPRKCGKTVCLKQLQEEYDTALYYDIKKSYQDEDKCMDLIAQIVKDIENNEDIIYLIDESTYIFKVDEEMIKIADAFEDNKQSKTKIVFSGSQANALKQWAYQAFGNFAATIEVDFIDYPEWLAFKNITEISEKTYLQFLYGTRSFYDEFSTVKDYIESCLLETVISNSKPQSAPYNNDCSIFQRNTEPLLDILYASLLPLHNRENYDEFFSRERLRNDIHYYFREAFSEIGKEEISNRISEYLFERYNGYQTLSAYEMQKALQFLSNSGLITLTYITDDLHASAYISDNLLNDFRELPQKEIFNRFNICIKHPFFYVELIKDILKDQMPEKLPQTLLGDIVERHVRGLLPTKGSIEYHDMDGREIDYVNLSRCEAIEISVSNKKNKDTHFEVVSDFKKIVLTKDYNDEANGIQRIPYYQFIATHSKGFEPVKHLLHQAKTSVSGNKNDPKTDN